MYLFGFNELSGNSRNTFSDYLFSSKKFVYDFQFTDNNISAFGSTKASSNNCFIENDDYVIFLDGILYSLSLDTLLNNITHLELKTGNLTKTISEIDGEFTIILYSKKDTCLYLIRDHFGTKPLYFSFIEGKIVWSSSCNMINRLAEHPLCLVSEDRIIPKEPYTSYSGIWQIPPSNYLSVNNNKLKLICYNKWEEGSYGSTNTKNIFSSLEEILYQRMTFKANEIAIPMSAGIDSGILAFYADKLGINYHIFSLTEVMGKPTVESEYIYKRVERLKNAKSINLIKCNEKEYKKALNDIFKPNYYETFRKNTGIIPIHTILSKVKEKGISIVIDGTGGDEIFHGYNFREQFQSIPNFPEYWKKNKMFYSMYAVLLENTEHVERAGRFFNIQSRFPFQNKKLYNLSKELIITEIKKWPLRKFLFDKTDYGRPLKPDYNLKYGLCMDSYSKKQIQNDIRSAFCSTNNIKSLSSVPPKPFNLNNH